MFTRLIRHYLAPISSVVALAFCIPSFATIVEFQLSNGESIQVNLYDQTTPKTVQNFLSYVDDGAYTNAVIHRSVPGFIVQGGGFTFDGAKMQDIPSSEAVINEPIYSNVRGTIAMAKIGDNVNSATNQWFFNLADNSTNLDQQNGGFTAFGQVVESDLAKVDAIAALSRCAYAEPFNNLPVIDFDCTAEIALENLVTIVSLTVIDPSDATDQDLTPVKNTLINSTPSEPSNPSDNNDSGGGSIYWFIGLLTGCLALRKFTK